MRRKINFAGLVCLLLCLFCAPSPASAAEGADAAICYQGSEGFTVSAPFGWVNVRQAADEYSLCLMLAPAGYDFHAAPAVIYPKTAPLPQGEDPARRMADKDAAFLRAKPGGEMLRMRPGGEARSASGLHFTLRYFDNGPSPNNYELVAYHVGDQAMLLLVLSARTPEARQAAEPAFMNMLSAVTALRIKAGR